MLQMFDMFPADGREDSACLHRFHEHNDGCLRNFEATPAMDFQEVKRNYAAACVIHRVN